MGELVVVEMPASGHVNPVRPVVDDLVRRGIGVRFCAAEEFRTRVEATGARFVPYLAGVLESSDIAAATQSGSSVAVVERILEAASRLTPWLVEQLQDSRPTAVLHDSNTIWGRMAAASCDLPRISFMTRCSSARRHCAGSPCGNNLCRWAQRCARWPTSSDCDTFAGYGGATAAADLVEAFLNERAVG